MNKKLLILVVFIKISAGLSIFGNPNISVVFVLDESGSVSSSNFQLETLGFVNALDGLPTNGTVEVSVIGFSGSPQTVQSPVVLQNSSDVNSIKTNLQNNTQNSGSTNMSGAIKAATNLISSSLAPTKVICISTDGHPNNESNTTTEANNSKNLGYLLTPIGIGLDTAGKIFLDSIASDPPVPNPNDFNEFSKVVGNVCTGVVDSALNIRPVPSLLDFGNHDEICSKEPKIVYVINESDKKAKITGVSIIGDNSSDFKLESINSIGKDSLTFPFEILPKTRVPVRLSFVPKGSQPDGSYSAAFRMNATDENGVSSNFDVALTASIDSNLSDCLGVNVIDASPVIHHLTDSGQPLKQDNQPVDENDVSLAIQNDKKNDLHRIGLIADGNARILITAKTRNPTGKIRFEILEPSLTESRMYPLYSQPTYKTGTREYDDNGKTTLDLDVVSDAQGNGQITAVLRAGERYLGVEESVEYKIKVCILENKSCGVFIKNEKILEKRAPVVLHHGIWANPSSFGKVEGYIGPNSEQGLLEFLKENNYDVEAVDFCSSQGESCIKNYPNHLGPDHQSKPDSPHIHERILSLCASLREDSFACTRADLIGHSMGGLMSRSYILRHRKYKNESNYFEGSVRRLITLGTPHIGSGLANLLWKDDDDIGSCIRKEKKLVLDLPAEQWDLNVTGREGIDFLIEKIKFENKISSGIDNLRLGDNTFLSEEFMNKKLTVPIFALYGNINDALGLDLTVFTELNKNHGEKFRLIGFPSCSQKTPNQCVSLILEHITGCTTSDVFNGEASDGIVTLSSGKWEAYIPPDHTKELSGVMHTGMGTNQEIMDNVKILLESEL